MRQLPPPHDADRNKHRALLPKALGLAIGLLLGYLLFPGSPGVPAAAPSIASTR